MYSTEGNKIIKRCKKSSCGERYSIQAVMENPDAYVYTGKEIKPTPKIIYSSNQFLLDMKKDISYENNINAGKNTAKVIIQKDGQKIVLPFSINKAEQNTPSIPEASKITSNSIKLNKKDGMEFSIDNSTWTEDNVFTGLTPSTQYRFKVRFKESDNYKQSPESSEFIVSTLDTNRVEYEIKFDGNGGVTELESLSTEDKKLKRLPSVTNGESTLVGWNTKKDGSGTKVTPETVFNEDTTIYAIWRNPTLATYLSLSGTLMYDEILTANVGYDVRDKKIEYSWYRGSGVNKTLIQKGSENTYRLVAEDISQYITVEITVEGYEGKVSAVSSWHVDKKTPHLASAEGLYNVNYADESINVNSGFQINDIKSGKYVTNRKIVPGQTLKIRSAETKTHYPSNEIEIQIPNRPNSPTGLNSAHGKITGVTDEMEYKLGAKWVKVKGNEIVGFKNGQEVEVRYSATDNSFASEVTSITMVGKDSLPIIKPTDINGLENKTIEIKVGSNYSYNLKEFGTPSPENGVWRVKEYQRENFDEVPTLKDGNLEFKLKNTLSVGIPFDVVMKYTLNDENKSSKEVKLTIKVIAKEISDDFKAKLDGSLVYNETLTATVEDITKDKKTVFPWNILKRNTIKNRDVVYSWYRGKGDTKTLVKKGHENTYKLGAEDINQYITLEVSIDGYKGKLEVVSQSPVSKKTSNLDKLDGAYTIDYVNESITFASKYEIKDGESWVTISQRKVNPGETIKIRLAETETHFASNEMDIVIPNRPNSPTGLNSADGKITGVTNKMEYKLGSEWVKVIGNEIIGPKDGEEVEVRYYATNDSFVSNITTIKMVGGNKTIINDLTVNISSWEYGKESSKAEVKSSIKLENKPVVTYRGTLLNGEKYESNVAPINPGKYTVQARYEDEKYIGISREVEFEVYKSEAINLSGLSVENKTFNKTDLAKLTGELAIEGIVNGDNVTIGSIIVNGKFDSSEVGNNKVVTTTVTGTLGGDDSWKYLSPTKYSKSLQGNILPVKEATISGDDAGNKKVETKETVKPEFEKTLLDEAKKVFNKGTKYKTYLMELELQELQNDGSYVYNPNYAANILLPYPKGIDSSYEFAILHLKNGVVEKIKFNKLPEGIELINTTTSPFAIVVADKNNSNLETGDDKKPGNGTQEEGQHQKPSTDKNSNTVQTGDTNKSMLFYSIIALFTLTFMFVTRKKIVYKK